jgi:hypothetical protein
VRDGWIFVNAENGPENPSLSLSPIEALRGVECGGRVRERAFADVSLTLRRFLQLC